MDVKCVRVLRPYPGREESGLLYVDEECLHSLSKQWGDAVTALGRRKHGMRLAPLEPMDQQGFIARCSQEDLDALYVEYGEEVLLS